LFSSRVEDPKVIHRIWTTVIENFKVVGLMVFLLDWMLVFSSDFGFWWFLFLGFGFFEIFRNWFWFLKGLVFSDFSLTKSV